MLRIYCIPVPENTVGNVPKNTVQDFPIFTVFLIPVYTWLLKLPWRKQVIISLFALPFLFGLPLDSLKGSCKHFNILFLLPVIIEVFKVRVYLVSKNYGIGDVIIPGLFKNSQIVIPRRLWWAGNRQGICPCHNQPAWMKISIFRIIPWKPHLDGLIWD